MVPIISINLMNLMWATDERAIMVFKSKYRIIKMGKIIRVKIEMDIQIFSDFLKVSFINELNFKIP